MTENTIEITNEYLIIKPNSFDKLWSFTSNLEVPLSKIDGATIDNGILNENKGLKSPGLNIPGYFSGTFYKDGAKIFFNIKRSSEAVVIQLHDYKYDRLVIGVEDPRNLVERINNLLNNS